MFLLNTKSNQSSRRKTITNNPLYKLYVCFSLKRTCFGGIHSNTIERHGR